MAKISRRTFLAGTAGAAAVGGAAFATRGYWLGSGRRDPRSIGKKVIVIGIDGMDPGLCERMLKREELPNLARLRAMGGFSPLGTSIPPQSPVAWANFINGAGPGSHGIFDFLHRHPEQDLAPHFSAAETEDGKGFWDVGQHRLQLDFWPFNHQPPKTVLKRQGEPFWDFLDQAHVPSTFYDLPSNFPPSPSHYGHHRCLCGMGTTDLLGTYGMYQHYATNNPPNENDPTEPVDTPSGKKFHLVFDQDMDTARTFLVGPPNSFLQTPRPVNIDFLIHRDLRANAALIEIQGNRMLLRPREWSDWIKVDYEMSMPWFVPNAHVSGICRFYLQEVQPNFKLYVTPVNIDPSNPAVPISEPASFAQDLSKSIGLFATTGFQEAYEPRKDFTFNDDEYRRQADSVLEERLKQFERAFNDYEDGLFYFYFSSCDLQSHIFWWDSAEENPARPDPDDVRRRFGHVQDLYKKIDGVIGQVLDRYAGKDATIMVMSDHGFANFGRQFGLNTWLKQKGYLGPEDCTSVLAGGNVDWANTRAYGLGINGLYLNLKGREKHGVVEPSEARALLAQIAKELEAYTETEEDLAGQRVISKVYPAHEFYEGTATALAPDLIIGYRRGYRASWNTCTGGFDDEVVTPNTNPWSADHCCDARAVPGVLFSNRPIRRPDANDPNRGPALIDIAPSILQEFYLPKPSSMTGGVILEP